MASIRFSPDSAMGAPPEERRARTGLGVVTLIFALLLSLTGALAPAAADEDEDAGWSISGTVTDEDGEALDGICIDVWAELGTFQDYGEVTDADGSWEVTDVPSGYYNLWFHDCQLEPDEEPRYRSSSFQVDGVAAHVEVDGADVTGIDAALVDADPEDSGVSSSLSGTVSLPADEDGVVAVDGVCMFAYAVGDDDDGPVTGEEPWWTSGYYPVWGDDADDGEIDFELNFGTTFSSTEFIIEVSDCGPSQYISLYAEGSDGEPGSTLDVDDATPVEIGSDDVHVELAEGLPAPVQVSDVSNGDLVDEACATLRTREAFRPHTSYNPVMEGIPVDGDGFVSLAGLAGENQVTVFGGCHTVADSRVLPTGASTSLDPDEEPEELNVDISAGGLISGSLTAGGDPFDGGFVFILATAPDPTVSPSVSQTGDEYVSEPLDAGTYEVRHHPGGARFALYVRASEEVTLVEADGVVVDADDVDLDLELGAGFRFDLALVESSCTRVTDVDDGSHVSTMGDRLHTGEQLVTGIPAGTYDVVLGCSPDDQLEYTDVTFEAGQVLQVEEDDLEPVDPIDPPDPGEPDPTEPGDLVVEPDSLSGDDLAAGTNVTVSTDDLDLRDADVSVRSPVGQVDWDIDDRAEEELTFVVPEDAVHGEYWIDAFEPETGRWLFARLEISDPDLTFVRSRVIEPAPGGSVTVDANVRGFAEPPTTEDVTAADGGTEVQPTSVQHLWGDRYQLTFDDALVAGNYDVTLAAGGEEADARLVVDEDPGEEEPEPLVDTDGSNVVVDDRTGEVTVRQMPFDLQDVTIMRDLSACDDIDDASIEFGGDSYTMRPIEEGADDWSATIPADAIEASGGGSFALVVDCADDSQSIDEPVGSVELFDPSGDITDADTGEPVVGAEVTLHFVDGWTPQESSSDVGEPETCQSNLTKPGPAGWNQTIDPTLGEVLEPSDPPRFDPNDPVQLTDETGRYEWDVAEGCWFVQVSADGYDDLTSPVVGVNETVGEVTDLDLELTPEATPSPGGGSPVPDEDEGEDEAEVDDEEEIDWLSCEGISPPGFTDVDTDGAHGQNVGCLADLELLQGYADGRFGPADPITREQFASVLDRALRGSGIELEDTEVPFDDVTGDTHAEAIARLAQAEIIRGVSGSEFDPRATITRGQIMALLVRASDAFDVELPDGGEPFPDTVGNEHEEAVTRARAAGIAHGTEDGAFLANTAVRRDQAASLFARWLGYAADGG